MRGVTTQRNAPTWFVMTRSRFATLKRSVSLWWSVQECDGADGARAKQQLGGGYRQLPAEAADAGGCGWRTRDDRSRGGSYSGACQLQYTQFAVPAAGPAGVLHMQACGTNMHVCVHVGWAV